MENILRIDTSNNKKIEVCLNRGKEAYCFSSEASALKSQVVLLLIDKVLKENKIELKDLTSIEVNLGPGSFTGLRVGVSVANALSYSLKIPVNGNKVGVLVEPVYNN